MVDPFTAATVCSRAMRTARFTTSSTILHHCARFRPRDQRAVGFVRAVRKAFGDDAQSCGLPGADQRGVGRAKQNQLAIECRHGSRDGRREDLVSRGHVVQRAVRLDVLQSHAFGRRHTGDRRDLIEHEIFGFLRAHLHVAATEAGEIRKARMRADRDARCLRQPNRVSQHGRIAAMEAGGDIGGRDDLHQSAVVSDGIGAERFADVRVQVHAHEEDAPVTTVAKLYKQKGTALMRCPSAHWPGSPSIHGALP